MTTDQSFNVPANQNDGFVSIVVTSLLKQQSVHPVIIMPVFGYLDELHQPL
jgi:hypothetical protein